MTPTCSIIVPVRDRVGLTRSCLEALLSDRPRTSHEIIVVDDGSADATADLLASYGDRIRVVQRTENGGFARACNDGVAVACGERLVFLNNDVVPTTGWLDELERYADAHPAAAAVGSKLLFADGSVQHAGVVLCQDGYPRHLYAGFPAFHRAVCHPRRLQAVTAAAMLVRRDVFEDLGGFDPVFRNGFEDVDWCLRAGGRGHEIHYCPDSVLTHLESASPGRFDHDRENARRWRERWGGRVRPDDLELYAEDGLLRLGYGGTYPLRLEVAPELAVLVEKGRVREVDRLLDARSRQVAELLREVVRLTSLLADREPAVKDMVPGPPRLEAGDFDRRAARIERAIEHLQRTLGGAAHSPALGYRSLVRQVQRSAVRTIPHDATILVVSHGDDRLLDLCAGRSWHFPQDERGSYAGHHPATSQEAIEHLEDLRSRGAGYLVIPRTSLWWLDHYDEFREHLEERYVRREPNTDACVIYELEAECSR